MLARWPSHSLRLHHGTACRPVAVQQYLCCTNQHSSPHHHRLPTKLGESNAVRCSPLCHLAVIKPDWRCASQGGSKGREIACYCLSNVHRPASSTHSELRSAFACVDVAICVRCERLVAACVSIDVDKFCWHGPGHESDEALLTSFTPEQVRQYFPPPATSRSRSPSIEIPSDRALREKAFSFLTSRSQGRASSGTHSSSSEYSTAPSLSGDDERQKDSAESAADFITGAEATRSNARQVRGRAHVPLFKNIDSGVYNVAARAAADIDGLIEVNQGTKASERKGQAE